MLHKHIRIKHFFFFLNEMSRVLSFVAVTLACPDREYFRPRGWNRLLTALKENQRVRS